MSKRVLEASNKKIIKKFSLFASTEFVNPLESRRQVHVQKTIFSLQSDGVEPSFLAQEYLL